MKAIRAEKFASRLADYYLSKKGYESQQTKNSVKRNHRHNLWRPISNIKFKTHGAFDSTAKTRSFQQWFSWKRNKILLGFFGVAATYSYFRHNRLISLI